MVDDANLLVDSNKLVLEYNKLVVPYNMAAGHKLEPYRLEPHKWGLVGIQEVLADNKLVANTQQADKLAGNTPQQVDKLVGSTH